MWSAVAAEGTDCFDAVSRAYSYVFQRPVKGAFYSLLMVSLMLMSGIVLAFANQWTINIANATTCFVCGDTRFEEIVDAASADSFALRIAGSLRNLTESVWRAFVPAYLSCFFLAGSSAIYLLLRLATDQTEMDEIFLENEDRRSILRIPDAESAESGMEANATLAPNAELGLAE